jgi:hypothetical protein
LTVLVTLSCSTSACGDEHRDYGWFLNQVMDLDRLSHWEEGVVTRQFSSYNRASYYDRQKKACVGMDVNGDAGFKLSVHFGPKAAAEMAEFAIPAGTPRFAFGDLEWVLDPVERNHVFFLPRKGVDKPSASPPENVVACIAGPGCIYRIWSADPMGKIRFYFDGSSTPMEFDFPGLFAKGASAPDQPTLANRRNWPFIRPMVFRRAGEGDQLAADCYLPIPFARSCVVTLSKPSFYHIGYKTFPPNVSVDTFRLPLNEREGAALDRVCQAFLARGKDPKPVRPGSETIARSVELPPGKDVVLAELTGPRIIQALHAKLQGSERYANSKVLLRAWFDDEAEPCIWSPLVNFFGTGFEPHDFKSYPLGYVNGEGYCYLPMPLVRHAKLVVTNEGTRPAQLQYRIVHAPAELAPGTMHFKCKYRREEVCRTFDYPFLECGGKGRFVGAALSIDDAWRSWWGEGDEKIWVDGDLFPSFFGTGSEDFFGDAWGIRDLHETFFACSLFDQAAAHSRTSCYRWLIPDDVQFARQFRATIENYAENIWGTQAVDWDEDYVSTAYWYQAPGGSDFFKPVPVEKRRPWGKVPQPPCVEAEEVLAQEIQHGATLHKDDGLSYEFSHGLVIELGMKKAGDVLSFSGPELLVEGPYAVRVHTPPKVPGAAAFELLCGGRSLGHTPREYGTQDAVTVGMGVFPKGRSQLTIRFTSSGRAVFDCFQFEPARQLQDVVEAEKARVVAASGPEPVREVGVIWSGGRQLRFPAAKPGDAVELEIDVPQGRWDLYVGQTRGPNYGDYEVKIDGQPPRRVNGYAAEPVVSDWIKIGKAQGRGGKVRLRFECKGKAAAARGLDLGLDYLGWKPVVVEDAIEGETARLTDVHDGRILDQQLGPRFSGGNHLWFHPAKVGASFTWLLDVPEEGSYDLSVYFTKSWDYAIVRVSLDGKPLGEFDTYAPEVVWAGRQTLGRFPLAKGDHKLKFEVVGHNEKSKGILVGVDCLTLERK